LPTPIVDRYKAGAEDVAVLLLRLLVVHVRKKNHDTIALGGKMVKRCEDFWRGQI
jgi:hypothetical protein